MIFVFSHEFVLLDDLKTRHLHITINQNLIIQHSNRYQRNGGKKGMCTFRNIWASVVEVSSYKLWIKLAHTHSIE